AARYDDIDDVESLASAGISLDSKDSEGRTAFHMASANGHLDVVEYLISSRVDVNASNLEKNTPLHWACLNGHVERTPLDEAVSGGKMDVIDAINTAVAQVELTSVAKTKSTSISRCDSNPLHHLQWRSPTETCT
ncbi:Ankyrin repeat, partial [Dillenia turbinata]